MLSLKNKKLVFKPAPHGFGTTHRGKGLGLSCTKFQWISDRQGTLPSNNNENAVLSKPHPYQIQLF